MTAGQVTCDAGVVVVGYVGAGSFADGDGGVSLSAVTGVMDMEENEKVV